MTILEQLQIVLGTNERIIPAITLANGDKLSVQASDGHYSFPRSMKGPYTQVEIGFPAEKIEKLMPYAEEPENPTETVYGYVPIEILIEVIEDFGGFTHPYLK